MSDAYSLEQQLQVQMALNESLRHQHSSLLQFAMDNSNPLHTGLLQREHSPNGSQTYGMNSSIDQANGMQIDPSYGQSPQPPDFNHPFALHNTLSPTLIGGTPLQSENSIGGLQPLNIVSMANIMSGVVSPLPIHQHDLQSSQRYGGSPDANQKSSPNIVKAEVVSTPNEIPIAYSNSTKMENSKSFSDHREFPTPTRSIDLKVELPSYPGQQTKFGMDEDHTSNDANEDEGEDDENADEAEDDDEEDDDDEDDEEDHDDDESISGSSETISGPPPLKRHASAGSSRSSSPTGRKHSIPSFIRSSSNGDAPVATVLNGNGKPKRTKGQSCHQYEQRNKLLPEEYAFLSVRQSDLTLSVFDFLCCLRLDVRPVVLVLTFSIVV